ALQLVFLFAIYTSAFLPLPPYSPSSFTFFFLPLRRAPASTLSPYTTLFRSVHRGFGGRTPRQGRHRARTCARTDRRRQVQGRIRSEEHTSELQSRFDLVCRLLLEKKKRGTRTKHPKTAA